MKKLLTFALGILLAASFIGSQAKAVEYLGDFYPGDTVYCYWNTFDADGSSSTRSTNGTVQVREVSDTGSETSTGVSEDEDVDANAGEHYIAVDTGTAGLSAGNDYVVEVVGAIVDSQTINAALCQFSIENRYSREVLYRATADAGGDNTIDFPSASASSTDNFYGGPSPYCRPIRLIAGTGAGQERCITSYDGTTNQRATINRDWDTNPDSTTVFEVEYQELTLLGVSGSGVVSANVVQKSGDANAADAEEQVIDTLLNCEVNTANFAGSTTTLACILTDTAGASVTQATSDLLGKIITITSGADIRENRYINSTTWDGTNSELRITLDSALPSTQADAVTAIIQ